MRTFIIAEAGINHNGSIDIAKKMVDVAVGAGADAVKFQSFKPEKVISKFAPKAEYQKGTSKKHETQLEMAKRLELDRNAHKELITYCKQKKIIFLSSAFDLGSIDLVNSLGLDIFKIPSGEITNLPYLRKIGKLGKRIIMSTGMSDLKEVENALSILIEAGTPKKDITILHCNTEYPTPFEDVNLSAMLTIRDTFEINVGYSDHTLGIEISIAAVALGATVIEKHFTLNRDMEGPDHRASLEPNELRTMIDAIRNLEKGIGDGIKRPSASELKNRGIVRKSIVASRFIRQGELFTSENITTKRPAAGINPMEWDRVIGRAAKRDFKEDESIVL